MVDREAVSRAVAQSLDKTMDPHFIVSLTEKLRSISMESEVLQPSPAVPPMCSSCGCKTGRQEDGTVS